MKSTKNKINNTLILIVGILLFLLSYKFDVQVNLFFKNAKFPVIDTVLSIATNFGVVILIILITPSIILYKKNKKIVYALWASFTASIILAFIIKIIVLRQRPIDTFTYPFISIINYSFPSMHAMAVFSLLPLLAKYLPKQKFFWVIFAFLTAFSRIYFRFHFLSDVIFGAFVGYFVSIYVLELYEKKKLRKSAG